MNEPIDHTNLPPRSTDTAPIRQTDEKARAFAIEAARLMADSKCTDVVALDLKGKSPIADCLVIGTGTSDRQMRSVAQDLGELGQDHDYPAIRTAEDERSTWIVIDFGTVVAHIFEPNTRAYYDLEMLWGDAQQVAWQRGSADSGGMP